MNYFIPFLIVVIFINQIIDYFSSFIMHWKNVGELFQGSNIFIIKTTNLMFIWKKKFVFKLESHLPVWKNLTGQVNACGDVDDDDDGDGVDLQRFSMSENYEYKCQQIMCGIVCSSNEPTRFWMVSPFTILWILFPITFSISAFSISLIFSILFHSSWSLISIFSFTFAVVFSRTWLKKNWYEFFLLIDDWCR